MFCPVCNQEQVSNDTRFCSRCGFLLTGVSHLIANGGAMPLTPVNYDPNAISPRKKGVKQGAFLLFTGIIVVPLLILLLVSLHAPPFLAVAATIIFGGGGLLRMLYAALFESGVPGAVSESVLPESVQNVLPFKGKVNALPPQQSVPVSSYDPPMVGNWRDTNDLNAPPSVTDPTTRSLYKK